MGRGAAGWRTACSGPESGRRLARSRNSKKLGKPGAEGEEPARSQVCRPRPLRGGPCLCVLTRCSSLQLVPLGFTLSFFLSTEVLSVLTRSLPSILPLYPCFPPTLLLPVSRDGLGSRA